MYTRGDQINAVEVIMENEPRTSLRRLSQQTDLSVETCRIIVKKELPLYYC
ncbi:hypothetical protein BDFB_014359 [Asbolus verrucosus]|uniref:HTH 24 domain containing protein n=1 Tax=Asbolus verrucosus TaxID=1661398 RepID=A0A482VCQ5_ASBVE|nr:hypothetical protein BDFB_014359 [Asbolus verrucosus]